MMDRIKLKRQQGFTLIEIVLVLAIAALILLLVFIALSGAQKARRDTARKQDAARMLASVENCAANNNGTIDATHCTTNGALVTAGYFTGKDPGDGNAYSVGGGASPAQDQIGVVAAGNCGFGAAKVAVYAYQEAGASYCTDDH